MTPTHPSFISWRRKQVSKEEKTIHDPIHGSLRVGGPYLDLLDTPEMQRLRGIRQLGMAYLVFPGGNHSRFEHSLGVLHLVKKFGELQGLEEEELLLLGAAALLHDIGHPPFSHTLEALMLEKLGKDHVEMSCELVEGKTSFLREEGEEIRTENLPEKLEKWGIKPREVASLLEKKHKKRYLVELLSSEVDLDQMDFLLRDAHFTGVALGMIDVERLLSTLVVQDNHLMILSKGIEAVEGMLTARALMYSSVYFHPTVRAAELMLANAVEWSIKEGKSPMELYAKTDGELLEELKRMEGYGKEMVLRLKYRRLFKSAYEERRRRLEGRERESFLKRFRGWSSLLNLQEEIADKAKVPRGYVLLDIPLVDLFLSEPRMEEVEIPVLLERGKTKLSEISPIAEALRRTLASRYILRVLTLPELVEKVRKAALKIL
ncbi:MAG: HD domain-containing protein [Candidatus Hadarchaeales archaeon]